MLTSYNNIQQKNVCIGQVRFEMDMCSTYTCVWSGCLNASAKLLQLQPSSQLDFEQIPRLMYIFGTWSRWDSKAITVFYHSIFFGCVKMSGTLVAGNDCGRILNINIILSNSNLSNKLKNSFRHFCIIMFWFHNSKCVLRFVFIRRKTGVAFLSYSSLWHVLP